MQYDVMIRAEGVSLEQLASATQNFRHVLESKLGGIERVRPCFLANAKLSREGRGSLFPQEESDAAAWLAASNEAEEAVKTSLDWPNGVGFMVKVGLPVH